MTIELKDGERLDDLQCNGLRIIQNEKLFCFGMDAVLLTGFTRVKEGERVLDLGPERGSSRFFCQRRQRGSISPGLRFRTAVRIWPGAVSA